MANKSSSNNNLFPFQLTAAAALAINIKKTHTHTNIKHILHKVAMKNAFTQIYCALRPLGIFGQWACCQQLQKKKYCDAEI